MFDDYTVSRVFPRNKAAMAAVDRLLKQEDLIRLILVMESC